ncbi:MAG: IMPACT family protein [Erysipelotrichaceae bacterium]
MYHVKNSVTTQIEVKKSRFICILMPLNNDKEIKEIVKQVKKQYPKASHYCYGGIINSSNRTNDDGEPASTAGKPILEALKNSQLEDVFAIVVRYFGGTLLGTSGLIKAYGSVTSQAIKQACLTYSKTVYQYKLIVDYQYTNKIEHLLLKNGQILDRDFTDKCLYYFQCDNPIDDLIKEATSSSAIIQFIKKDTVEIEV